MTTSVFSNSKERSSLDLSLSKLKSYWNPEHPPPLTLSLKKLFFGSEFNKNAILDAAFFVNSKLDSGKIISQKKVRINKYETSKTLAKKILIQEHKLYPEAIIKIFSL